MASSAWVIKVDPTTITLAVIASILLGLMYHFRTPASQAHPFILGRQSTVAPTRKQHESPIYTNSSTGGLRAPIRPDKSIKRLSEIIDRSKTCFEGGTKGSVWVKRGDSLVEVVKALKEGLVSTLEKNDEPVAVVIEHPIDALVATLALAMTSHQPIIISPASTIPADLSSVTAIIYSASLLSTVQFIPGSSEAKKIILGSVNAKDEDDEDSTVAEDLLATGRALVKDQSGAETSVEEAEPKSTALTIVSDGVALQLTHINLTASLVSFLAMFPGSPETTKPTINDTVLSLHHPSTPYGFGLALFLLYSSASLTLRSLPAQPDHEDLEQLLAPTVANGSAPTLIFGPTSRLSFPLYRLILSKMLGDTAVIIKQARNGKIRLLRKGYLTKTSIWDSLLFNGIRKDTNLTKLRAVFFSADGKDDEPLEQARSESLKASLGVPIVQVLTHSSIITPITNSLYWDAQRLPRPEGTMFESSDRTHVGAPTIGLELKLVDCSEQEIEKGRFKGEIVIRTPALPHPRGLPKHSLRIEDELPELPVYPRKKGKEDVNGEDGVVRWFKTGIRAEFGNEGTLWL